MFLGNELVVSVVFTTETSGKTVNQNMIGPYDIYITKQKPNQKRKKKAKQEYSHIGNPPLVFAIVACRGGPGLQRTRRARSSKFFVPGPGIGLHGPALAPRVS